MKGTDENPPFFLQSARKTGVNPRKTSNTDKALARATEKFDRSRQALRDLAKG